MFKTHWFWWKLSQTPEQKKFYNCYMNIKARCNKEWDIWYKNYWWRWIKCEWNTFNDFMWDMRESFLSASEKHWLEKISIDRIDVDWNYCKSNCRWATQQEQQRNKRNSMSVEIDWEILYTWDLANMLSIDTWTAYWRIIRYKKWILSKEELFSKAKLRWSKNAKKIDIDWVIYTSKIISDKCWISIGQSERRISNYEKWLISKDDLLYVWRLKPIIHKYKKVL